MYPASWIRWADARGAVVLLDLRTAQYVALGAHASAMWRAVLANPVAMHGELAAFAERCLERGYLQRDAPSLAAPAREFRAARGLLAWSAWWALSATSRRLARAGFSETYRRNAALAKPRGVPEGKLVERAQRAFLLAENAFVARRSLGAEPRDCLPRSLALHRFLLGAGIAADHVIGVTMYPFSAHAWVECRGVAVCDATEDVRHYTEIARL